MRILLLILCFFQICMAQPSVISSSTAVDTVSSFTKINKPSNVKPNDLLIAIIGLADPSTVNGAMIVPLGWTLLDDQDNTPASTCRLVTYYKKATASEPANYTWRVTTSTSNWAGGISCIRGHNENSPINQHSIQVNTTNTTHTSPSITPNKDNCLILGGFNVDVLTVDIPDDWVAQSGWTAEFDIFDAFTHDTTLLESKVQTTAAAITASATLTHTQTAVVAIIAIAPASAGCGH